MDLYGTAGIRGSATTFVTPQLALNVGRAVATEAHASGRASTIVLGRDGRLTGKALADAVAAGVESGGADVVRLGQAPTPTIGWASRGRHGIAVTASHNPPEDNGLKLFDDGVEYGDAAEARIEKRVAKGGEPADWKAWGRSYSEEMLPSYAGEIARYARDHGKSLDGVRVVVDCGNGVAGLATPEVLDRLNADVVSLHANVDGYFPGRRSKPTKAALEDLRRFLAADPASLGIAHDGDGDRVVFLDGAGTIVHEDTVLAILARHYVSRSSAPDPVVVTTPNASARIDKVVRTAGGRTARVRLGALHEGIDEVERVGGTVVFAAEPWKHIHTRFGGWIDGILSASLVARLVAAEGWESLRADINERPYRKESIDCPDAAKAAVIDQVAERIPGLLDVANLSRAHGVRAVQRDGAWVLVRASGTEPKVRIYVESDDVDEVLEQVRSLVTDAIGEVTS